MKKRVISFTLALTVALSTFSTVFAVSDTTISTMSDDEFAEVNARQTEIKEKVSDELEELFGDIESLNEAGALYWDGDVLTLGIKKSNTQTRKKGV